MELFMARRCCLLLVLVDLVLQVAQVVLKDLAERACCGLFPLT